MTGYPVFPLALLVLSSAAVAAASCPSFETCNATFTSCMNSEWSWFGQTADCLHNRSVCLVSASCYDSDERARCLTDLCGSSTSSCSSTWRTKACYPECNRDAAEVCSTQSVSCQSAALGSEKCACFGAMQKCVVPTGCAESPEYGLEYCQMCSDSESCPSSTCVVEDGGHISSSSSSSSKTGSSCSKPMEECGQTYTTCIGEGETLTGTVACLHNRSVCLNEVGCFGTSDQNKCIADLTGEFPNCEARHRTKACYPNCDYNAKSKCDSDVFDCAMNYSAGRGPVCSCYTQYLQCVILASCDDAPECGVSKCVEYAKAAECDLQTTCGVKGSGSSSSSSFSFIKGDNNPSSGCATVLSFVAAFMALLIADY